MTEEQAHGRIRELEGEPEKRLSSRLAATMRHLLRRKAEEQPSESGHAASPSQESNAPPVIKEKVESKLATDSERRFAMSEEKQVTDAEETPGETAEAEGVETKIKGRDVLGMLKGALDTALVGRGNVIMVRVNDDTLKAIDMLVEADVCKSRSEGAAFLINQGIEASSDLYDRISGITEQIAGLKAKLRKIVTGEAEQ